MWAGEQRIARMGTRASSQGVELTSMKPGTSSMKVAAPPSAWRSWPLLLPSDDMLAGLIARTRYALLGLERE